MLMIETLQRIDLGIRGENQARTILIDCNAWKAMYPNGTISIFHRRPGEELPGVTGASWDSETGILSWTPSEYDTFYAGSGAAEIRCTEGTTIRKTSVLTTLIRPDIVNDENDTVLSNWEGYIAEVERLKNETNAAKEMAIETAGVFDEMVEVAQQAASDAGEALEAARVVSTRLTELANSVEERAENAIDIADDAAEEAEQAKRDAILADQAAERAKSTAEEAQAAAEAAILIIEGSVEDAEDSAEAAAESETAAAGSAQQAAGSASAAAGSAQQAAGSASAAAGNATAAAGSASAAAGNATAAAGSATAAAGSATAASESATNAAGSAQAAAEAASKYPYIDTTTGTWWVWDVSTEAYVDTGYLARGPQGIQGNTGATPNLQIGTVATLSPGSQATAAIRGTAAFPLLDLGIPKGETPTVYGNDIQMAANDGTTVGEAIGNKVDKVNGKGLSTNDYTTAEKQKLAAIQAEANKTIVDSTLNATSQNPVQNQAIHAALNEKVDKINGKGLSENDYTTAEKQKLQEAVTKVDGNTPDAQGNAISDKLGFYIDTQGRVCQRWRVQTE